jgi:hypothetical protein
MMLFIPYLTAIHEDRVLAAVCGCKLLTIANLLNGIQEVTGSIPVRSTNFPKPT